MSKKNVTLTRKQWGKITSGIINLASLASETHDVSIVEAFLTNVSNDFDLMATDSTLPVEASGPAEIMSGVVRKQTHELMAEASEFLTFIARLDNAQRHE